MERLKYSIESDTRTCKVSLSWNLNAPGLPSKGLNETLPPDNGDISLYVSVHKALSSFADVIVSRVFLLYVSTTGGAVVLERHPFTVLCYLFEDGKTFGSGRLETYFDIWNFIWFPYKKYVHIYIHIHVYVLPICSWTINTNYIYNLYLKLVHSQKCRMCFY